MSFRIDPLPPVPEDERYLEARSLYNWAFTYFLLSFMADVGGWIMIFSHKASFGLLAFIVGWIAYFIGRSHKKQADRIL